MFDNTISPSCISLLRTARKRVPVIFIKHKHGKFTTNVYLDNIDRLYYRYGSIVKLESDDIIGSRDNTDKYLATRNTILVSKHEWIHGNSFSYWKALGHGETCRHEKSRVLHTSADVTAEGENDREIFPGSQSSDLDEKLIKISLASGRSVNVLRTEFLNYELCDYHSKRRWISIKRRSTLTRSTSCANISANQDSLDRGGHGHCLNNVHNKTEVSLISFKCEFCILTLG